MLLPFHGDPFCGALRSEEHTSELQSRFDLVCRLLLEKKKAIHRAGVRDRAVLVPAALANAFHLVLALERRGTIVGGAGVGNTETETEPTEGIDVRLTC